MQKCKFSCKVQIKITYYSASHEPFLQSMTRLPFLNFSHQKSNTILHHMINGQGFIFSLDNLNEGVCPIFSLQRFTYWSTSLFQTGWGVSCLPHFINFASTYSITTFCLCLGISEVGLWLKYGNVVLYCLPIFCFSLTN